MIFTRAACEPAHSYGWGSWLDTVKTAGIRPHVLSVCAGDCGAIIPLESYLVLKSPLTLCQTAQQSELNSWESNKNLKSEGLVVYDTY